MRHSITTTMSGRSIAARASGAAFLLGAVAAPCSLTTLLAAQTPAQAVERLRITPAVRTVAVGDSLQLVARALDG